MYNQEIDVTTPHKIELHCSDDEVIIATTYVDQKLSLFDFFCKSEGLNELVICKAEIQKRKKTTVITSESISSSLISLSECKYIKVSEKENRIPDTKRLKKIRVVFKDGEILNGIVFIPYEMKRTSDLLRKNKNDFILIHIEDEITIGHKHFYIYVGKRGNQIKRIDLL